VAVGPSRHRYSINSRAAFLVAFLFATPKGLPPFGTTMGFAIPACELGWVGLVGWVYWLGLNHAKVYQLNEMKFY
jgi:hypothetical protein